MRQALAYATDRGAIAKAVFSLEPELAPIDSFSTRASPFYVDAFSRYRRNLQKVDQIMRADGWNREPGDGIWARQGERAKLEFATFDMPLELRNQVTRVLESVERVKGWPGAITELLMTGS